MAPSVGSSSTNLSQVGTSISRATSGVRSAAGSENRSSSTLCTNVPRTASTENASGSRSTVRNRNISGQVMKSAARLGEIAPSTSTPSTRRREARSAGEASWSTVMSRP